jgi:hypothetical protein
MPSLYYYKNSFDIEDGPSFFWVAIPETRMSRDFFSHSSGGWKAKAKALTSGEGFLHHHMPGGGRQTGNGDKVTTVMAITPTHKDYPPLKVPSLNAVTTAIKREFWREGDKQSHNIADLLRVSQAPGVLGSHLENFWLKWGDCMSHLT